MYVCMYVMYIKTHNSELHGQAKYTSVCYINNQFYLPKACYKNYLMKKQCALLKPSTIIRYRIAQNVGGGKHWQIWRLSINSPKFSHPNIVNTLKCNGKPTQFAKVLPSNYTSRVISPKFHPANNLRYTVYTK